MTLVAPSKQRGQTLIILKTESSYRCEQSHFHPRDKTLLACDSDWSDVARDFLADYPWSASCRIS